MALDSKKYTKVSESLASILDAVMDGFVAAGEKQASYDLQVSKSDKHLCLNWMSGQNTVLVKADVSADSCNVVVSGDGSWYTNMTGPLDTLFGV